MVGRNGTGHYVLAWDWGGYYDCVDIDVRSEAVENIYGVNSGEVVWNRVDHCQYIAPQAIKSQCYEVIAGVDHCRKKLPGSGMRQETNRYGVNVVPLHNPSTVAASFRDQVNLQLDFPKCGVSTIYEVPGTRSFSAVDWETFENERVDVHDGVVCSDELWQYADYTLQQAVVMCSSEDCLGLSWLKPEGSLDLPTTGLHTFIGCSSVTTSADSEWVTAWKVDQTPADDTESFESVTVVYTHWNRDMLDAPPGYVIDRANEFGLQDDGYTYGWNCAIESDYVTGTIGCGDDGCDMNETYVFLNHWRPLESQENWINLFCDPSWGEDSLKGTPTGREWSMAVSLFLSLSLSLILFAGCVVLHVSCIITYSPSGLQVVF